MKLTIYLIYTNDLTEEKKYQWRKIKDKFLTFTILYPYMCTHVYTRSVWNVCSHVYYEEQRHLLKNIQYTRNTVHRTRKTWSPSKQALSTSQGFFSHHRIFLNLNHDINFFPFKGDFSFGKNQELQGAKSGLQGAELPG